MWSLLWTGTSGLFLVLPRTRIVGTLKSGVVAVSLFENRITTTAGRLSCIEISLQRHHYKMTPRLPTAFPICPHKPYITSHHSFFFFPNILRLDLNVLIEFFFDVIWFYTQFGGAFASADFFLKCIICFFFFFWNEFCTIFSVDGKHK